MDNINSENTVNVRSRVLNEHKSILGEKLNNYKTCEKSHKCIRTLVTRQI